MRYQNMMNENAPKYANSTERSTRSRTRANTAVQPEQKEDSQREGDELHLHEIHRLDLVHPDVMVQNVDRLQIGAAVPPDQLVGIDREPDSLGELVGEHRDL